MTGDRSGRHRFSPADFLNPSCSPRTVDIFHDRSAILRAMKAALPLLHGTVLDIGCGHMPYKSLVLADANRVNQYIGMDFKSGGYGTPDLEWDGTHIPLGDGKIDSAIATEVFEHAPQPEQLMREAWRVLKPGGVLFFTVPFLWPLHDVPHDEYRFTPFSLRRHLVNARFDRVEIRASGGWDASLAQMIGLWARRRPMGKSARSIATRLAVPIVRWLVRRDRPPSTFERNTMITGLNGTAFKGAAK